MANANHVSNYKIYIKDCYKFRILSPEEVTSLYELDGCHLKLNNGPTSEERLLSAIFGNGETEKNEIISRKFPSKKLTDMITKHNLLLVVWWAKRMYSKTPIQFMDLIQIGNIALMSAAKYFDHKRENTFSTYASKCIVRAMKTGINKEYKKTGYLTDDMIVEIGKYISAEKKLMEILGRVPTTGEIKETLNEKLEDCDKSKDVFEHTATGKAVKKYKKSYTNKNIINIEKKINYMIKDDMERYVLLYNNESIWNHSELARNRIDYNTADKASESIFLEDYATAIEELSDLEQEVIKLYFDNEGKKLKSGPQIGEELSIDLPTVYKVKTKALDNLSKNQKLQSYRDESNFKI